MIAMMARRRHHRVFLAWMASFAAYTGFWAYHTAAYGFWYAGPIPWWLTAGLTGTLTAAVTLTVVWWRRARR